MPARDRLPLLCDRLPSALVWSPGDPGVRLDRAADELARFQVYRYCSLPEALQWLGRRRWTLVHPRCWPDRCEGRIGQALFAPGAAFAATRVHAKCLSFEHGSEALWSLYRGPAAVVRIGIALYDLLAMLRRLRLPEGAHFALLRMRYLDESAIQRQLLRWRRAPGWPEIELALAMKRAAYVHENELRICLLGPARGRSGDLHVLEDIDIARVRSLQLDPALPRWQAEELIEWLRPQLPAHIRLQQSRLHAMDVVGAG